MPPSQIQTGIFWQTEEEAGRQCSLCRALSGHSRPAGLSLLSGNFGIHALPLRQDCRRWQILFQVKHPSTSGLKAPPLTPSLGFHLGPVRSKGFLDSASWVSWCLCQHKEDGAVCCYLQGMTQGRNKEGRWNFSESISLLLVLYYQCAEIFPWGNASPLDLRRGFFSLSGCPPSHFGSPPWPKPRCCNTLLTF